MTSPLEERIKSSLNESAEHLAAETRQRLQSIRREALNQPERINWLSLLQSNYWAPAAGLTVCSLFVALVFLPQTNSTNNTNTLEQIAMFELLDSPEDFSEDLEVISDPAFYLWMDELEAHNV